jgi:electron transport complex protein RnfB
MFAAIAVFAGLALTLGLILGLAAHKLKTQSNPLVDSIDALLPQTQCGQCAYPGCRPYAEAIATGEADINQCPPGGEEGVIALAELLGREPKALNPDFGAAPTAAMVAFIREDECIGCTLCIQACPVDAIVGANKLMHTVIQEECTGCELCIPPCPVDCIDLHALPALEPRWAWPLPSQDSAV